MVFTRKMKEGRSSYLITEKCIFLNNLDTIMFYKIVYDPICDDI